MNRGTDSGPMLRAGAARIKTTPSEPVPLAGFYDRKGSFESVHDDLFARATVFESEGQIAAIISVDICIMSDWFWSRTVDAIAAELPIPKDHILLNASHTHGGPALYEPPDLVPIDSSFMDDNSFDEIRRKYTEQLTDLIVEVTKTAYNRLTPATIGYSTGVSHIGVNRREANPEGGTTIGVNPEGPVDRELIVIRVDGADGVPVAVLFNLGVHGVSMMSRSLTGDWCGIAQQEIEKRYDGSVIAQFISGAAGNINPIILAQPSFGDPEGDALTLAYAVRDEVVGIAGTIMSEFGGPVAAAQKVVSLPGKRYLGLIGFDPRYDELAKDTSPVPDTEIRMSAVRIGPCLFGATNAETFCEIGMEFKEKAPVERPVFMGMTNGYVSYIPSDNEISKGGYEWNASLVREGGQRAIVDTLLELAGRLKKE